MKCASRVAGVAAALLSFGSGAAELEYGVELGIGTSDNIGRARAGGVSEEIATAGLDVSLDHESSRLEADIEADLSYFDYLSDTFESQLLGVADADIRFNLVPERFRWVLIGNFGQTQIDPFVPIIPSNIEDIAYLTTGPDLGFGLGTRGSLWIFGRYSFTDYQESNFDDERLLGGVALARESSARSRLSLNATIERIEFDDPDFGTDYDRQSVFARYEFDGARTRIAADAGYAEIQGLERPSGAPLLEINVERDISEQSIVELLAGTRSSDAATSLRAGNSFGGPNPGIEGEVSSADPYVTDHALLDWQFTAPRTEIMLSAGYENDVYENQSELDRERYVYTAFAERGILPRLSMRVRAMFNSYEFVESGQENDETEYGLGLIWNISGRLFAEGEVYRFERDSTDIATQYDETRFFLRFSWRNVSREAPTD